MTDEELIKLVQNKTPADLTFDEISLLRLRLIESAELRSVLLDQPEMEQYLHEALGRAGFTADDILAKSDGNHRSNSRLLYPVIGVLFCLVMISVVGVLVVRPWWEKQNQTAKNVPKVEHSEDEENSNEDQNQTEIPVKPEPENSSDPGNTETQNLPDPQPAKSAVEIAEPQKLPTGPWDQQLAKLPVPFAEAWRQDFDLMQSMPDKEFLDTWFKPDPKSRNRSTTKRIQNITTYGFSGNFELLAPLPENVAMRLSLWDQDRLALHFFHKDQGVSVYHYRGEYDPWFAYVTTRKNNGTTPDSFRVSSNDSYAARRSNLRYTPTLLIYYDAATQELVIYQGDVELIRAPLPGPPQQIFFEGSTFLRGLELVPLKELPPATPDFEIVQPIPSPAELPWDKHLAEDAELVRHEDGSVAITTEKGTKGSWVAAPIPGDGIRMVDFHLQQIERGASVFLGIAADTSDLGSPDSKTLGPDIGITFSFNRSTDQLYARWSNPYDKGGDTTRRIEQYNSMAINGDAWVRIMTGMGQNRAWISVDGKNWALIPSGSYGHNRPFTHMGMSIVSTDSRRALQQKTVRLKEIVVRKVTLLNQLVSDELYHQSPIIDEINYPLWFSQVLASKPEEVDLDDWMIACCLKAYVAGKNDQRIIQQLGLLAINKQDNLEDRLAILDEIAFVSRSWPGGQSEKQMVQWIVEQHENLLGKYFSDGRTFDLLALRSTLFSLPLDNRDALRFLSQELITNEILRLMHQREWEQVKKYCDEFRFFSGLDPSRLERELPLLIWGHALAVRESSQQSSSSWYGKQNYWRSPLLEELSKEAYNISADLSAALESNAYQDACKIITGVNLYGINGLAPSTQDQDLLFSLPAAITLEMRQDPELRAAMNREFSDVAMLRVQAAMHEGNTEAVKLVGLQFYGTEAASEANLWLGDRAMAIGQTPRAMAYYQQAANNSLRTSNPQLDARMQLVSKMLGETPSIENLSDFQLGETEISQSEITSILKEPISSQPGSQRFAQSNRSIRSQSLEFKPSGLAEGTSVALNFDMGDSPNSVPSEIKKHATNWVGQQLGTAVFDNTLLINNRFQVSAVDLKTSKIIWNSSRQNSDRGKTHTWQLQAMTPVVAGEQIFTRMLHRNGPHLYCLSVVDGTTIWHAQSATSGIVICDPIPIQGELLALTAYADEQKFWNIRLTRFDPETGDVVQHHQLIRLRPEWSNHHFCTASVVNDMIIAQFGGAILACDLSGSMRWVRKQTYTPANISEHWAAQHIEPPVVVGSKVIVLQPGVSSLDCVEIDTGELAWSQYLPEAERIVSADQKSLIVRNSDSYQALHVETGELQWELKTPFDVEWEIEEKNHVLVASTPRSLVPNKVKTLSLHWIEKQNGQIVSATTLDQFSDAMPQAGPLLLHDQNLWMFYSEGERGQNHQLLKLQPKHDLPLLSSLTQATDEFDLSQTEYAEQFSSSDLTDWQLLTPECLSPGGLVFNQQKNKFQRNLSTKIKQPLVLGKFLDILDNSEQLKVELAPPAAGQSIQLLIQYGSEVLFDKQLPEPDLAFPTEINIALPRENLKQGWLQIISSPKEKKTESDFGLIGVLLE
ncbi:MAG: hypothetical protein COA78_23375 [Blastopirellula sp.]|nr:MAG: hypothetical protein COA78_23375 [Blastopirellula sp.]